ncbi:MAG: hypothetical protein IJR89_05425 [Clostridia bacterium]|nr:hypothetical protein [Clostridia bacterium]
MNGITLFDAIAKTDDELLDRACRTGADASAGEKKKTRTIRRIALAAACAVLAVCALAVWPFFRKNGENPAVPIENKQIPSDAPRYFGKESSAEGTGGSGAEFNPYFLSGLSVTAKLTETLPDTYTFFDDWNQNEYRLLRMTTVALLKGAEMTDEFYYLIPTGYMTDFSLYDRFVIRDMAQCGYGSSVLYNKTQGKAERLTLVLFAYQAALSAFPRAMGRNMIAFGGDGRFDERLWQSWNLKPDDYGDVPATLAQAERAAGEATSDKYVRLLTSVTGEAVDVLSRISSLENGVFVPRFSSLILSDTSEVSLRAVRYIGGFATNEAVRVWSEGTRGSGFAESKASFSEEDLNALPDLASAISAVALSLERGEILPPHIENADKLNLAAHGVFGWYAKTGEGVLGIVRVTWRYTGEASRQEKLDDAYYTVEYASDQVRPIDRDDLLEKLGEYETTYIFDGAYTADGKVYAVSPVA